MDRRFHAVVPAGGSGTRLWPLSRAARPKFLLPLPGPQTMLQATVDRLRGLCAVEDITVITGPAHAEEVRAQRPDLSSDSVVVEPSPRGTGPAIGLGAALIARRDPDAIMGSFAADHIVERPDLFHEAVRTAIAAAEAGYLVTIGIQPSWPETGYGYIRRGAALEQLPGQAVFHVDEFKEKPDLATATRYVAAGTYLWNASMFVWKASTLLDEMRRLLPDVAEALETIANAWDTPERLATLDAVWPHIREVTIDHGILEHSHNVAVVPADIGWTDLGDWHGFGGVVAERPDAGVAIGCEVIARGSENTVVYGNGRLIALVGVDNVIVVDTDDALLVCERTRAQEVKFVVDELKRRGLTRLV